MSNVNQLLLFSKLIRTRLWEKLGIEESIEMPFFHEDLLYGIISAGVHQPNIIAVYISNMIDDKFVNFITHLAQRKKLPVEVFIEEAAASGEDIALTELASGQALPNTGNFGEEEISSTRTSLSVNTEL